MVCRQDIEGHQGCTRLQESETRSSCCWCAISQHQGVVRDKDGITPTFFLVMPNIAIAYKQSMTFITPIDASATEIQQITDIFDELGESLIMEERLFPAATAMSCAIAYAMRYVRANVEGGVEMGFKAKDAQKDCTPNRKRCRRATSRNRRASRGCHRQGYHSWRLHHQGPQHHGTEWIYQCCHQGFNSRKEVNFLVSFGTEVHITTNKKRHLIILGVMKKLHKSKTYAAFLVCFYAPYTQEIQYFLTFIRRDKLLFHFRQQAKGVPWKFTLAFSLSDNCEWLGVGSILCHHHLVITSLNLPLTINLIERSQVLVWDMDSNCLATHQAAIS